MKSCSRAPFAGFQFHHPFEPRCPDVSKSRTLSGPSSRIRSSTTPISLPSRERTQRSSPLR